MPNALYEQVRTLCEAAKRASRPFGGTSAAVRNELLLGMAERLRGGREAIFAANREDLEAAEASGLPAGMRDRLRLDGPRLEGVCRALAEVAALPDPIGSGERTVRPNGLEITRIRVPLGCVAIIYEARPNVTVDAAALCLKTGNAVVLRGGSEAIRTNGALVRLLREELAARRLNPDLVGLVASADRESAAALMEMRGLVDVLIPRGGKGLIRSVVERARVPVIETGAGNCHVYVDERADLTKALAIAVNAKCSRPSVCNAMETLLVHRAVAADFLPAFAAACAPYQVEFRGDETACARLPGARPADEADYETEYNDYILAVRVVDSLDEALDHIARYSTGHSEAIVTEDLTAAARFRREVDAAAVYVNASTRFTDGGEFGFGAEIGISTQKLHARGPMGLYALTTDKYLIDGNGQVR